MGGTIDQFARVVAADGGSTDGSRVSHQQGYPLLEQPIAGRGVAFRVAAEAVDTDRLIFYSPDGNEDPADIIRPDDARFQADLAIASRFAKGSVNEETDWLRPRARVNKALTWIANQVFVGSLHYRYDQWISSASTRSTGFKHHRKTISD